MEPPATHQTAGGRVASNGARNPSDQFERHLLRRSVDLLAAERATCCDCGRTPLVGEQVHLFAAGELICELCRPLRREQPVSTVDVRHSEYGQTVRVTRVT